MQPGRLLAARCTDPKIRSRLSVSRAALIGLGAVGSMVVPLGVAPAQARESPGAPALPGVSVAVPLAGPSAALGASAGSTLARNAAVAVTDDRGVTAVWAQPPPRVVSLLPSLTESVCALGGCERLVGTDRYSNWPPSVHALPKLGGLDDAVIERIVALRPDAVLAAVSMRAVPRLEALGLKVLAFHSDRHEQVQSSLERLSGLMGEPDRARVLWQSLEADIERAAAEVPVAWRGRTVYFETDSAPYAAGVASFIGQTLARLGLVNIAPASLGPFPRLNPEFVVRAQPDLIIGVQHQVRGMADRPGWSSLQALRRNQVCAFDVAGYERLVRPGPRLGEAARDIARCIASLPVPGPQPPRGAPGTKGD